MKLLFPSENVKCVLIPDLCTLSYFYVCGHNIIIDMTVSSE